MTVYWMKLPFLLSIELMQREEEGCDVSAFRSQVASLNDDSSPSEMLALYDQLSALKALPGFPYSEPSDLEGIRQARPAKRTALPPLSLSSEALKDRILGAWLGRCVGCTLGKPVEGLTRAQIETYLKAANAYPLDDYIPLIDPFPEGVELHPSYVDTVRGRITYMSRDDDTDYTILGLHILEKFGPNFTSADVAETWLDTLPYNMVFTAERVAYRNLCNDMPAPQSASFRNPFREWIGAQIRADGFAYAAAGYPEIAAELAYRDAAVSHVKNGIYGEMFIAAVISAAFLTDDLHEMIRIGLDQIPVHCRFSEMVNQVVQWSREIPDWQTAWDKINLAYGKYFWAHTINNAAVVLLSLLYGGGDLARSIAISVMSGWDTDCNGATVGSIIGAWKGARALPASWTGQLNDILHSAVIGFDNTRISDLALRSWQSGQTIRVGNG
jgi:ADP-ribosylglycohydrolase